METTNTTTIPTEYPTLSDRVQSTFIDSIFIVIMMFVFASVLEKFSDPEDWVRIAMFFGLWAVYEPLCTSLGYTIGNLAKGIRVRSSSNMANKINFFQAFIRYMLKMGLGWLSFLTIHTNNQKRAIHDLAVGSVMIKK